MKRFKNKNLLIFFLLLLISAYILCFKLFPSFNNYYKLKRIYVKKLNMKKLLKIKLLNEKRIKPIKFKAGNHRFSTNLLTVLSYINYLRKSGYDIKVKVLNKKSLLKSKDIIITLNKISNIGVAFSLLRTFRAFPSELKKISIKSGKDTGIRIVVNERLIGLT
jgi:hypothetical protein